MIRGSSLKPPESRTPSSYHFPAPQTNNNNSFLSRLGSITSPTNNAQNLAEQDAEIWRQSFLECPPELQPAPPKRSSHRPGNRRNPHRRHSPLDIDAEEKNDPNTTTIYLPYSGNTDSLHLLHDNPTPTPKHGMDRRGYHSLPSSTSSAVRTTSAPLVPIFDSQGVMHKKQKGIKYFQFQKLALFHNLLKLPWKTLIFLSITAYVSVVTIFALLYFTWGAFCGVEDHEAFVGSPKILSYYFSIVSLAANGGYLGEPESMTNSSHLCFTGRTVLVGMCSYTNIVFVGLVAALIVGKAESREKLSRRIIFSEYCTLNAVRQRRRTHQVEKSVRTVAAEEEMEEEEEEEEGNGTPPRLKKGGGNKKRGKVLRRVKEEEEEEEDDDDDEEESYPEWRLDFRLTDMEPHKPAANGRLRLYCVSVEKQVDYWESKRRMRIIEHKRKERLRKRKLLYRQKKQKSKKKGADGSAASSRTSSPASSWSSSSSSSCPNRNTSSGSAAESSRGASPCSSQRSSSSSSSSSRCSHSSCECSSCSCCSAGIPSTAQTVPPGDHSLKMEPVVVSGEKGTNNVLVAVPGNSPELGSKPTNPDDESVTDMNLPSGLDSHLAQPIHTAVEPKKKKKQNSFVMAAVAANSLSSSISSAHGAGAAAAAWRRSLVQRTARRNTLVPPPRRHRHTHPHHQHHHHRRVRRPRQRNEDAPQRKTSKNTFGSSPATTQFSSTSASRVRTCIKELCWTCDEEDHADHYHPLPSHHHHHHRRPSPASNHTCPIQSYNESNGVSVGGSLHLWYPVVISHHIDRSSPLFRFLYDRWLYQQEAASREEEERLIDDEEDFDEEMQKINNSRFLPKNTASRFFAPFQVVAVYEAVEQGTGAAILAKKTFTPFDIIQSYRFSSKLVQLDEARGTVELDYHYFNTMVPLNRDVVFGPNARGRNHRRPRRRPGSLRQGRRGRSRGKFHSGSGSGERRSCGTGSSRKRNH